MHNPITLAIPEGDEIGQDPSIYVREKQKIESRNAKKGKEIIAHRPHP
jgi:hypothetical protein